MYFFSKYRDIPIIFIMIFELSKTMLVGDMRQMALQCLLKREMCLRTVALTNSAGTCSRGVAQIYTLKVP